MLGAMVSAIAVAGCTITPAVSENTGAVEPPRVGEIEDFTDIRELCGDKDVTVAYLVISANNAARMIQRAEFDDEARRCPNITKTLYVDSQNDPQRMRANIDSLVAQGVDIIIAQDLGPADLPAVRRATAAGVQVVPFISDPGGVPGRDYTAFVAENVDEFGKTLTDWVAGALGDKGSVIVLGGPAGNAYSHQTYLAVQQALAKYPDMTLLGDDYLVTDWEVGKTQQAVAGALTKYPNIDGVISTYGGGSVGGIRAFLGAGRPLPVWATSDANEFSCLWEQIAPSQPQFQIATQSLRPWMTRVALRHGLAAAQGIPDTEPTIVNLPFFEDSIAGGELAPQCNPDLPPDASLSTFLTEAQLSELFTRGAS
ncbi:substrate-binding domain-containing protein [Mycolicibacterium baixiangningiae]|uniref:substrate-binding domain-containing protein n=2 Tax=Mycolicibacterium baixiangningiae TaxID=2761578 RepID=UPI00299F850F|nr:substrate-binding domain-containing protein [Mycolicibacterium baixiangningiae]